MATNGDYSYFERDEQGRPVRFVEYHDSHIHDGKCPHVHETDMREVTIGSICKGGNYHESRKVRETE